MRIHLAGQSPSWNCGGAAARVLRCDRIDGPAILYADGAVVRQWADPLDGLRWMSGHFDDAGGRWVGFLSYELGRLFERLPASVPADASVPLYAFGYLAGRVGDVPLIETPPRRGQPPASGIKSGFSREGYLHAVRKCIDYIEAGDVFQVNLSQRFEVQVTEPASVIWQRLQADSPAIYGAYIDLGNVQILSNSPELFLEFDPATRQVRTRPIKGTRPMLPGMDEELRSSIKDQAELNMIVDLERNDLGRVCTIGSVRVTEPRTIEAHPTVYHGVATVAGTLRDDVDFVALLAGTFPGGSITGAPKIRAMEIIDELEPTGRGVYCGAIGYIAADDAIELNIAIRTMTIAHGKAHVPVGGGIVADSDPQMEYDETLVKARAMFAALGIGQTEERL